MPIPPGHTPHFGRQRPDHAPPETLTDRELTEAIDTLGRKVRSARRAYVLARLVGVTLTVFVLGLGFTLLYFGPASFAEHVFGQLAPPTTYDVFLWWLLVLILAVAGGTFGDQILRGRQRTMRGWKNRSTELTRRLDDAEAERQRRATNRSR
jgi:hypothetical protein